MGLLGKDLYNYAVTTVENGIRNSFAVSFDSNTDIVNYIKNKNIVMMFPAKSRKAAQGLSSYLNESRNKQTT